MLNRFLQQLQCDFSVMISPKMFEEFVLPELEAICGWLDYSVYHLDGQEQIAHLDYILSVKRLNAIQWTYIISQPNVSNFIPVFKKIQRAGKNLILMPHISEVEILMRNLSSRGLQLIVCGIANKAEAIEIERKVAKWTKE